MEQYLNRLSEKHIYIPEPERQKRIVACIRQLCQMRDTKENKLQSLYAGGPFPGVEISWMEEIANQHRLHADQVEQLIRIVLDLD